MPIEHPYNLPFTMDPNGVLRTSKTFDYETDDVNYPFSVWARDEFNASVEGSFVAT